MLYHQQPEEITLYHPPESGPGSSSAAAATGTRVMGGGWGPECGTGARWMQASAVPGCMQYLRYTRRYIVQYKVRRGKLKHRDVRHVLMGRHDNQQLPS
jgi:hypothetical protein